MRMFREELPAPGEAVYPRRFDLLIVDEAHNVAPSGRGAYALDSDRTQAIRTIGPHFEHKLFLTATPHNGYPESFSALLELLDNQRFARDVPPNPALLRGVMVRRMKSEIVGWDGKPKFPAPVLAVLEVAPSEEERQAHRWLQQYTQLRQKSAAQLGGVQLTATEFVLKLLKKRMLSSPAAFAATLAQHERTLAEIKKLSGLPKPSLSVLRAQTAPVEDEAVDDADYEDTSEQAMLVAARLLENLSPEERDLLAKLKKLGGPS